MPDMKQVDKSHYAFAAYMDKARWISVWHQLDEVLRLAPTSVLEVGPGSGVFKAAAAAFGLHVQTLDPDPELAPDHVGTVSALPFADGAFDLCCAFQVLEHLPYEAALAAFAEMARVARSHVVISLPDARTLWHFRFHVPRRGPVDWVFQRPQLRLRPHRFDGEHHWEINTEGYPLDRVCRDFGRVCRLARTFRVPEYGYHRFFVFETTKSASAKA